MQTQRNVVSHALQRRHTLEALRSPQVDLSAPTACDADPMLVRAAMHHGEPLNHDCPVCESPRLALLRHAFGHQLGQYSGRIRTLDELEEMEHQFGEFHVYEVRSEEHTSELQSPTDISYAVFCLKKKKNNKHNEKNC